MLDAIAAYGQSAITRLLRERLDELRHRIVPGMDVTSSALAQSISIEAQRRFTVMPGPLINATGVIVHGNLGRSPLSAESIEAIAQVAAGYSALEYDVDRGMKGSRNALLAPLLSQLTGADDGLVVNTNAAAIMVVLAAIARGREILVSHSQAMETGGGFRIGTILSLSGAKLVEVGTTNRTRIADYAEAISPKTAALLNIRSIAHRNSSFVEVVAVSEMVSLAHHQGIPVIDDVGSGCLLDLTQYGLSPEPLVQDSIAAGADLVCFSGDKLLGGPQSGIVVGGADFIARVRRHPLMRSLRIDKITLAALHATVLHYLRGEAIEKIPIWRMISTPLATVEARAVSWIDGLGPVAGCKIALVRAVSSLNGGSTPGESLPTCLLSIRAMGDGRGWASHIVAEMRHSRTPVLARVEDGAVLLDPRTVLPGQEAQVLEVLRAVLSDR